MWVQSLGWKDPSEDGMATHSSVLAWRIPWTEEPGGLQSMGWQSRTWLSDSAHTQYLRKPDLWLAPGNLAFSVVCTAPRL